jgi:hypothetical protein
MFETLTKWLDSWFQRVTSYSTSGTAYINRTPTIWDINTMKMCKIEESEIFSCPGAGAIGYSAWFKCVGSKAMVFTNASCILNASALNNASYQIGDGGKYISGHPVAMTAGVLGFSCLYSAVNNSIPIILFPGEQMRWTAYRAAAGAFNTQFTFRYYEIEV